MSDAIRTEIQKFAPSQVIELFVADLTPLGGEELRFHAGTNENKTAIVWQGETYAPWPITVNGFEKSTNAQLPRPTLQVSNVSSSITALILLYGDLTGVKITRKRTKAKFLDAVNFEGGVNPDEDQTAEYPDDIYYIEQKTFEDNEVVEFQLSSSLDMEGRKLPRRQIIQNICPWRYRGAECGYAGPPVADKSDKYLELSTGLTSVETDFINARNAHWASQAARIAAAADVQTKTNAYNAVIEPQAWVMIEEQFDETTPATYSYVRVANSTELPIEIAYFEGVEVTIGNQYRTGAFERAVDRNGSRAIHRIQRWGFDSVAEAAAAAAVSAAQAVYDAAVLAEAAALATYEAALEALTDDPNFENLQLVRADVCGKRLASCKLRFNPRYGNKGELPFGGYPGAGQLR